MGSRASFQQMAESSPVAMVIWDSAGTILEANPAFYRLLGFDPESVVALNYWALTASAQKQRELNHLLAHANELYEKEFLTRDGVPQTVRANGFVLSRDESGPIFSAVLWPSGNEANSESIERERALRRQNALLLKLARSPALASGDLKTALREITEAAAQGLSVSRASIWFFEKERRRIVCQDLFELDNHQHSEGASLRADDFPAYFAALAEDRAISADDAHSHPATHEFSKSYLTPLGIQSMLEAPVRHKSELIGVLCHEHCRERRTFRPEEVSFAGQMADCVARALEAADRRRAEQALQAMNQELERRVDERARALQEASELVLRLQNEMTESKLAGGFAKAIGNALTSASIVINRALGRSLDGELSHLIPPIELHTLVDELFQIFKERLAEPQLEMERARELFGLLSYYAETTADVFTAVRRPIERALKITSEIMEYSLIGQSRPARDLCQMSELIRSVIAELQGDIEESQIDIRLDLDGPPLYGWELHYLTVIRNVLQNCCDSLKDRSEDRPRRIRIRYHLSQAGALLSIEDNGIGIPDEIQPRLFEPFVTTDPRTHTGLGMAIIHKVMSLYEGTVDIHSVFGKGTRIELLFPSKLIAQVAARIA